MEYNAHNILLLLFRYIITRFIIAPLSCLAAVFVIILFSNCCRALAWALRDSSSKISTKFAPGAPMRQSRAVYLSFLRRLTELNIVLYTDASDNKYTCGYIIYNMLQVQAVQ